MLHFKKIARCLFEIAFFILAFVVTSASAVIALVTALVTGSLWFFFGWLGGVVYFLHYKLTKPNNDSWSFIFGRGFIHEFGLRGPLFFGEAVAVAIFSLVERLCPRIFTDVFHGNKENADPKLLPHSGD